MPPHAMLGRRGEKAAARHLKRSGYAILERNYTVMEGEIDLIAFRDGTIVFVEVRSQTEPALIDPLRTVNRRKQSRVIRAAKHYASVHRLDAEDVELRFDVIRVLFGPRRGEPKLTHVEAAFGTSARMVSTPRSSAGEGGRRT